MAYRKKAPRAPRKRTIPRQMARKAVRTANRRLATSEFASMKQTINLSNDQNNVIYKFENICLEAFDRAVQVARAYQYFRMTMVEIQFKPFADTFANSTTQSVPYLHWLVMKGDTLDPTTFNAMRDAGAKPIRFDDKTITIRFKPGVQNAVIGEDTLAPVPPTLTAWAESRISPWLATSYTPAYDNVTWAPSKVPHKGLYYGVQQDYSTVTQYYDVSITAHFQFKKPLSQSEPSTGQKPTPKLIVPGPEPPAPAVQGA